MLTLAMPPSVLFVSPFAQADPPPSSASPPTVAVTPDSEPSGQEPAKSESVKDRVGEVLSRAREGIEPYIDPLPTWSALERRYSPIDLERLSGIDPDTGQPVTRGVPLPPPDSGLLLSRVSLKVPVAFQRPITEGWRTHFDFDSGTLGMPAVDADPADSTVGVTLNGPVQVTVTVAW